MICDNCGKDKAKVRKTTKSFGSGESLLIIENVPVVSCSNCGITYLTAQTLHEVHRIKIHRKAIAAKKSISVAKYQETRS